MKTPAPRALAILARAERSARQAAGSGYSATRGHATAVDAPAPGPGVSREDAAGIRRYQLGDVRHDWRRSEIQRIFDGGLMETIFKAASPLISVYRQRGYTAWRSVSTADI